MIESMAHEPRLSQRNKIRRPSSRKDLCSSLDELRCCGITICREGRRTFGRRGSLFYQGEIGNVNQIIFQGQDFASTNGMGKSSSMLAILPDDPTSAIAFLLPGSCLFAGQPKQRLSSDSSPFPLLGPSLVPPPTPWKPLTPFLIHGCTCTPSVQLLLVHSDFRALLLVRVGHSSR